MANALPLTRAGDDVYAIGAGREAIESSKPALSWPAVLGGTVTATAVTVVLVALGSGMGLAWVSPLSQDNPSLTSFTLVAAVWLIVVQWVSLAFGGYVTGRLRTRWVGVHSHEVFFRDTAHGFVTWATSTLIVIVLISSTASGLVGADSRVAANLAGGVARGGSTTMLSAWNDYAVDSLFRGAQVDRAAVTLPDAHAQALRILTQGVTAGTVTAADRTYLAQMISTRTGIPQDEAERRVDNVIAQQKSIEARIAVAANDARKAAASASLFAAVSMLIGAFIACAAAAFGGSQRDEHL